MANEAEGAKPVKKNAVDLMRDDGVVERLRDIQTLYNEIVGVATKAKHEKSIKYFEKRAEKAGEEAGWFDPKVAKQQKKERLLAQLKKLEEELSADAG